MSGLFTLILLHLQHLQRLGGLEKLLLIYTMKNLVRKEVYFVQLYFFFGVSHCSLMTGSYPRSYYEAAIKAGRILVSGRKVNCDYRIKGGDELTHTVHRHEPAVGLADTSSDDPIRIVYEDETLVAVDKPATLPIHPCGE